MTRERSYSLPTMVLNVGDQTRLMPHYAVALQMTSFKIVDLFSMALLVTWRFRPRVTTPTVNRRKNQRRTHTRTDVQQSVIFSFAAKLERQMTDLSAPCRIELRVREASTVHKRQNTAHGAKIHLQCSQKRLKHSRSTVKRRLSNTKQNTHFNKCSLRRRASSWSCRTLLHLGTCLKQGVRE